MNEESSINLSTIENCGSSSRNYFKKHLKYISATRNYQHDVLEEYLSSAEEDCNALEFWKVQSIDVHYSNIVQMARDYLVVQATSVPSERMFLMVKHTILPTCNRLLLEKVCASICLKT